VMRDQETLRPRDVPPLRAVGVECIMCQDLADKAQELAEGFDPVNKRLPPGVRVVPAPWRPEDDEVDT
jgi:hypothetical protein